MIRYDAAIVGASYAGLACAAQMPGRHIILLDRHQDLLAKQRSSLGLLLPLGERVDANDSDLYFHGLELPVSGGVRGRISRLEIRGPKERIEFTLNRPLFLLDESIVKRAILKKVEQQGAVIRTGSAVREVQSDGQVACIKTEEEIQARIVIGADGGNSLVARSFSPRREKLAMLFAREMEFDRIDLQPETLQIQIDDARNWFVALCVGGHCLACAMEVVGVRGAPSDLDRLLEDKVQRLSAGRVLAVRSAVVRLHAPTASSFHKNVVLTGDAAASLGIATIAGAISMGQMAGKAANRFLAGSRYALPDYQQKWRKRNRQFLLDHVHWAAPVFQRLDSDRVDRVVRALRGSGHSQWSDGNLMWRIPALIWQLVA